MLEALERAAKAGVLTKWGFDRGGKTCPEWICHTCQMKYVNVDEETDCINEHCTSVIASRALATVKAMDEATAPDPDAPIKVTFYARSRDELHEKVRAYVSALEEKLP
jgi:hypothetical protein